MTSASRRIMALAALAFAPLLLGGCERTGIGLPMAMIYENTTTPFRVRPRSQGPPKPLIITDDLKETRVRSYRLAANIPGIPASSRILSVGWGNISGERAIREGEFRDVVYADAQTISVLGLYTKTVIKAYGLTEGMPDPSNQIPPPEAEKK